MSEPDFVICMECETPVYIFEWRDGRVLEALCTACGNEDPSAFATEEEFDDMSAIEAETETDE